MRSSSSSSSLELSEASVFSSGNSREAGQSAQAFLVAPRYHSRDHRRLAFLQRDAAFIFTVRNNRNAIQTTASQSAQLDLQFHAHIDVAMHRRRHLDSESEILIVEGRERSSKDSDYR